MLGALPDGTSSARAEAPGAWNMASLWYVYAGSLRPGRQGRPGGISPV